MSARKQQSDLPKVEVDDIGENLKRRVLLPLAIVFTILAAVFAYSNYRSEHHFINLDTEQRLATVSIALKKTLEIRGNRLLRGLEFLEQDDRLHKTLASGDRKRMQSIYAGLFKRLRDQFGISHFYFIAADRTVLLRMHQPERHGDRIDRFTLIEAERTGRGSVGLELGPIGTLALRAVKPLRANGKLLGYIELSEEVQPAIQDILALTGNAGLLVLHKSGLSRTDWESGMRMLGRKPDWDRLPTSVVVYSTLPQTSSTLDALLPQEAHPHFKPTGEVGIVNRIFQTGFVPIADAAGHEVGDLVMLRDMTATVAHMRQEQLIMIAIAMTLGALLTGLFWLILGRVQLRLSDARERLIDYLNHRRLAEAEIEQLAYYDPLTKLPNRRLLIDRIGHALAASVRDKHHGALLSVDLDHFNLFNDTRGHEIGDRLLVEVASRLRTCIREVDTVARLSGDEFVVLLEALAPERTTAAAQVEAICAKIRAALAEPIVLGITDDHYHCTASIGVDLFCGGDATVEDLLKHADTAMHQAKAAGRDCLRFFDSAMQSVLETRAKLGADLRRARESGQLVPYYQPQLDQDGKTLGAEVLLRWIHPERGLVSPADFIPLAEETGLIVPIGHWVLETACRQLARWRGEAGKRDLQLAVNVSARQFRQPDFIEQVHAILDYTGANPARLKLELTESLLLDNVATTIERMGALKALGIDFSLDDFGTGYSSLSYLKRLPLGQLKIDRSFISDIATDSGDAAIVRTIIAMADSLGLEVIAEGVETTEQRDFLLRHGCTLFQGYLFARPLPQEEFDAFLDRAG